MFSLDRLYILKETRTTMGFLNMLLEQTLNLSVVQGVSDGIGDSLKGVWLMNYRRSLVVFCAMGLEHNLSFRGHLV